jgi:hypothetical protein
MGLLEMGVEFDGLQELLFGLQVLLITKEGAAETDPQLIAVGSGTDESFEKGQRDVVELDPLLA